MAERKRNPKSKGHTTLSAEGEGFEPPELSLNCFQDSRNRPLCHPSATKHTIPYLASSSIITFFLFIQRRDRNFERSCDYFERVNMCALIRLLPEASDGGDP